MAITLNTEVYVEMVQRRAWNTAAISLAILLALALTIAGCTPEAEPEEPTPAEPTETEEPSEEPAGGHMVVAVIDDPPTFDIDRTTWFQSQQSIIYDGLVEKNDIDGSIVGKLAHDWEISEDGLEWTFYLRDDVTFHCEEPFNAEAYKLRTWGKPHL
jgi:peptide/nickel transport system substrate-binding protein